MVPQNCCVRPELVQGDLGRLQPPNAALAAHRSSHGQHPAQLLLHSIWGTSDSAHLSVADAAKEKTLASQPGATCSRYPKDTFPLRGLTRNMHPLSLLSISMHTCAYFADYFLN